ncbi:MAG: transposase, partial [Anaerolineales bacterium]
SVGNVPMPEILVSGKIALPNDSQTRPDGAMKRQPLSEIVRAFKSFSARRINVLRKTPGIPIWQRNYYEHIIRNEDEFYRIQSYIESNPVHWMEDTENPG